MISIIIPFVDEFAYLEEAITSAIQQDLEDFEIIVVRNQAALALPTIQENSVWHHPSIRWVEEPQRGSAFARNKGLSEAKGDWIQFLDVDDVLLDQKINRQLQYKDSDVVLSPHTYQFVNGRKVLSAWAPNDVWSGLLSGQLGSTSSMLFRRSQLLKINGWNTAYWSSQEYELLFRLLQAGSKIAFCSDHLTLVRERRQGSITKVTRHKPWFGINLREEIWSYLSQHALATPRRYDAFRKFIFKNVRALYMVNPDEAKSLHHKYFIDPPFSPEIPYIPFYGVMYKSLGFDRTEKLIAQYRYLRDSVLKLLPSTTS